MLLTRGHGYVLEVLPGELDLDRFADAAERGREALATGRPVDAARLLREALALWRGPPLAEFSYEGFARNAIAQLEELHLGAVEERVEADLVLGQARGLVGELRDLAARHPLRERPRGQLMLALYRSGRQAEALEVYQEFRRTLSEELGLEPGPGLQQLELAILARDPALDLPAAAEAPGASEPGRPGAAGERARRHRWPAVVIAGAVLVALVLIGVVAEVGGGRAAPAAIPGDAVGAISLSDGAIRAVVPLGTSPSGVATGDGAVWVASPNHDTVSRIDPVARAVVQTIPVGSAPVGVAVGDGSVWVANASDRTVSRIDAVSGAVSDAIALGGAGATDVAVGAGSVWVSDEAGDRVVRVDPQTDQVSATINVGSGPTAIEVGFGSVWVTNSLDGTVSRIDPATSAVQGTIEVGDGAGAIAIGQGAVWVADQYAGTVARIDAATDTVTRRFSVGSLPEGVAIADGLVWVGARAAATSHRRGDADRAGFGRD